MPTGFNNEIWRNSPEYEQAYEEGYNAAKKEMTAFVKKMEALTTVTGTLSFEERN